MKQKLIKIIGLIVLVLIIVVLISTRGTATAKNPNSQKIADLTYQISELEYSKTECLDNLTYKQSIEQEKGFTKYCVEYDEKIIGLQAQIDDLKNNDEDLREPGMITEDGLQQVMPEIKSNTEHERFKELASNYGLDAGTIWNVENHYGITEGVILCITIAETSGGNRGAGGKNIGSVGSNDRGDRPTYALMESGLEDIGRTLNNKYLGKIQTLGCLSNGGSCQSRDDNGKRYATSDGNWERNMVACLSTIYGQINAENFNIRR